MVSWGRMAATVNRSPCSRLSGFTQPHPLAFKKKKKKKARSNRATFSINTLCKAEVQHKAWMIMRAASSQIISSVA